MKDTFFCRKFDINCSGILISMDKPLIMGVLNLNSDSFYDKSRVLNDESYLERIDLMLKDGMNILDLGAYSSRPGAAFVSEEEEIDRLSSVLSSIRKSFPELIISVDTFRSKVARFAVENGANMINDISAGELDNRMFETIAELEVPYVMMHMRGKPETMMKDVKYDNILKEIYQYFDQKINKLEALGVKDIILDLGYGFSKTLDQNYFLLQNQNYFRHLQRPILTGISRKSMIYKLLETNAEGALNGTSVLNFKALENGANIIRVHDVEEASEVRSLFLKLNQSD